MFIVWTFFFSGALAVGYYGNEAVDNGVDGFVRAVEDTNATVENSLDLVKIVTWCRERGLILKDNFI